MEAETQLAERIAAVWSDVLDHEHIDPNANFFYDLDGHSMAAAIAVAHVADELAVPLELVDLYEAPTLAEFGERVGALRDRLGALRDGLGADPDPSAVVEAWLRALATINATAAVEFMAEDAELVAHTGAEPVVCTRPDEILAFLRGVRERGTPLFPEDGGRAVDAAAGAGLGVRAETDRAVIRRVELRPLPTGPESSR